MKFILYTIVILYVLYKLNKFFVRFYFTKFVNNQQRANNYTQPNRKEGQINVEYLSKEKNKHTSGNKGDYVDYEVVK